MENYWESNKNDNYFSYKNEVEDRVQHIRDPFPNVQKWGERYALGKFEDNFCSDYIQLST